MKITKKHALIMKRAVALLGGQDRAAPHFGVSQATISNYINQKAAVPQKQRELADCVIKERA